MYHSRLSGKFYGFATPNGPGSVQQFELVDNGGGKVDAVGAGRVSVDAAGGGHLVADIEGMSIEYGANGSGHLFVSSQGDSTIAVYDRTGGNSFVKKFTVGANGTLDGVTGHRRG